MKRFFPLVLYIEMFRLGLQTTQMLWSSREVIHQRGKMIQKAMKGEIAWTDPEFAELWQEKIFANMKAGNSLTTLIVRKLLSPKGSMAKHSVDAIKAIAATTLPYQKKAAANAKRLRGK
jgi:hypothetical protein